MPVAGKLGVLQKSALFDSRQKGLARDEVVRGVTFARSPGPGRPRTRKPQAGIHCQKAVDECPLSGATGAGNDEDQTTVAWAASVRGSASRAAACAAAAPDPAPCGFR